MSSTLISGLRVLYFGVRAPLIIVISFLTLTSGPTAKAAKMAFDFIEFEMPTGWQCSPFGQTYRCLSMDPKRQNEAVIVLAAKPKIAGAPNDTLEAYQEEIKIEKVYRLENGKELISKIQHEARVKISNAQWFDCLAIHSEMRDFLTRYMATVTDQLGILFTFSVHKDHYSKYAADFDLLLKSIKLLRAPSDTTGTQALSNNTSATAPAVPKSLEGFDVLPSNLPTLAGGSEANQGAKEKNTNSLLIDDNFEMLLYFGGGIIGLILLGQWRKRRALSDSQNDDQD